MALTEVVSGTLKGMGYLAQCRLLLTCCEQGARVMRCSVVDAPDELPDGYYEARFSDQSAFLRRCNRAWGTGIAWVEIPSSRQAESSAEPSVAEWTRRRAG